jgi:hypothetical protein
VAHVAYGLSLMNRGARVKTPSQRRLGGQLEEDQRDGAGVGGAAYPAARPGRQVAGVLRTPREVQDVELSGMIGSIAHLAYHMGAIRQMSVHARGPPRASVKQRHASTEIGSRFRFAPIAG